MSAVTIRLPAIESAVGWIGTGNTNDLHIVGAFAFTSNAREVGLPGSTNNHSVKLTQAGYDELVSNLPFIAAGHHIIIEG